MSKRRHPGFLVHGEIGYVVDSIVVHLNAAATTNVDTTLNLFRAPSRMRILKATYLQTADATAATSYTCQIQDATKSTNLTSALDIKALGANAGADFAGIPAADDSDGLINDGDRVVAVFDETGGTVTGPGDVQLMLEVALLE